MSTTNSKFNMELLNSELLNFERQMFLDIYSEDGLIICAKGIPFDRVLLNFLKVHVEAGNLILVINSNDWQEELIKANFENKYINAISNIASEREKCYLNGGLQFISTRVFVVDMLKKRVPLKLITGIIVLRAHTIIESCQEAFAMRLYRQTNSTGFIKAFTNSAESFTIGYNHLGRTMRNLFVSNVYIWPRYHALVAESLKSFEINIVELNVPMTAKMLQIQNCILDIIKSKVKEIRNLNRRFEMEEITVENCISKKFHKIIQAQLDCLWNQVSPETKLIISELNVLRSIILSTLYQDSVSTYSLMKRYRTTEYATNSSGWTLLDAAEKMFSIAKSRVFNNNNEFEPEPCPKWDSISEILRVEIPNGIRMKKGSVTESATILILCQDVQTCYQINQYLVNNSEQYLLYNARNKGISITKISKRFTVACEQNKFCEDDHFLYSGMEQPSVNLSQSFVLAMTHKNEAKLNAISDEKSCDIYEKKYFNFQSLSEDDILNITSKKEQQKQPVVFIRTFNSNQNDMTMDRMLEQIDPQYVIMYHCNAVVIRQLEIFEARLKRIPSNRITVFFLLHGGTVEEQAYLTYLRREKLSFDFLINTKNKMVISAYQGIESDEDYILFKKSEAKTTIDSRLDNKTRQEKKSIGRVIVDMREFRSDLPCLLHNCGLQIFPVTISVGDYILTPDICVERKSISDLISSLNSGRLYNQCIQMHRFYESPTLLIEFDQHRPFHFQGKDLTSCDDSALNNIYIVQKLQLLTIQFPRLRIIWSRSPYATVQIFMEIKEGHAEPNDSFLTSGTNLNPIIEVGNINPTIYDFFIRLPGINFKNIIAALTNSGDLKNLLIRTETDLLQLLGSELHAKAFYNILHKSCID